MCAVKQALEKAGMLDMRTPEMKAEVTKTCLEYNPLKYYKKNEIKPGETCVLYYNNHIVEELGVDGRKRIKRNGRMEKI